jgi:DNA-directed RNA polymerase subunit RPC12/RpoP
MGMRQIAAGFVHHAGVMRNIGDQRQRTVDRGELQMENYNKQAEENLLTAIKAKENADKRVLNIEIALGLIATLFSLTLIMIGLFGYAYGGLPLWTMIVMVSLGAVLFFAAVAVCLRIEQKAGYYECKECGHRYVPTYAQVLFAPHINRSRYMKCPHCGKRSYQKKVISEQE